MTSQLPYYHLLGTKLIFRLMNYFRKHTLSRHALRRMRNYSKNNKFPVAGLMVDKFLKSYVATQYWKFRIRRWVKAQSSTNFIGKILFCFNLICKFLEETEKRNLHKQQRNLLVSICSFVFFKFWYEDWGRQFLSHFWFVWSEVR